MVRKFTKSKAVFPTDDSIRKVIYMSVVEISIPETELDSAIAELREYAGVVVVDEGERYTYMEKSE